MRLANGQLVLSPTDLIGYLHCPHLTQLSLAAARGQLPRPTAEDPEVQLVEARGIAHEKAYLARLRERDLRVVTIDDTLSLPEKVERTAAALKAGVDVCYQAAFFTADGPGPAWVGFADFLSRCGASSSLGAFSYEPEDTKLARHVRPDAVLQLCAYAEQLERLQGRVPDSVHVILGGQRRVSFRLVEFAAYFRMAKQRFEDAVARPVATYPDPVEHCGVCVWRPHCDAQRLADDHLSLVPGLSTDQARKLAEHGRVTTVAQLAAFAGSTVQGMAPDTVTKLRRQAALLVRARTHPEGPPPYELLPTAEPGIGLGALPEPDPADLFFDIEGDPFVGDDGIEYLLGVGWGEPGGGFGYQAFWGHTPAEEKAAFESFMAFVMARRAEHPNLHIYHYAAYEPTALGRLMGRYGTCEQEVDALLRGGVLVDLYHVVRQGACVGIPSYSLKKLEGLYRAARTEAITDAGSSIVEYERWLQTQDPAILTAIATYNEVDCASTRALRQWLEERRAEYGQSFGAPPSRPLPADSQPPEGVAAEIAVTTQVQARLEELAARADTPTAQAARLLGDLLGWHRREAKPVWWRFFNRVLRSDGDDLLADPEAIAKLEYLGQVGQVAKSAIHRYHFDPTQPFKMGEGSLALDPATERRKIEEGVSIPGPGTLDRLDPVAGTLDLKRGLTSAAPHPEHLIPGGPISTVPQRQALQRLADAVIADGMDGPGPYRAARDLLLCRPPRVTGRPGGVLHQPGEDPAATALRLAGQLDHGCLAIQGPPGSGKTRSAAEIVVELVRAKHTVGLTANSHAVITHLLDAVMARAAKRRVMVRASQKADGSHASQHPDVVARTENAAMAADLDQGVQVLAGTAWLFARPEFDQRLDYLVVDEAGQLSLANVCAIATAAKNLILVGDPRQLSQPSEGTHPPGSGASALEHLLAGAATMPADRGIFLDQTHRLHPEICAFVSEIVYEGRLQSRPGCERQAIVGNGPLAGSGLRWVPLPHRGNRELSPKEAAVVRRLVHELTTGSWTNRDGMTQRLRLSDILIVAPYNAQVALLGQELPTGARVGTVDRFQGQQAPVVIVSLTTSSPDQIPHGMDFLYSQERLNVAVSRAQALTVLVGSPDLLRVACRTVDQLRLANGLCRYMELAEEVAIPRE